MDLPEPIYRVQLTEHAAAQAQRPTATPAIAHDSVPVNTRVQTDLDPQIEHEQRARGEHDLLDPSAPQE